MYVLDLYKNTDMMWKQSVWTSTISSHLAAVHLKQGGLLTLAGAKASLGGTSGKMPLTSTLLVLYSTGVLFYSTGILFDSTGILYFFVVAFWS